MHFIKDRGYNAPLAEGITPRSVLKQRRRFLKQLAAGGAGPALALWAGREALAQSAGPGKLATLPSTRSAVSGAVTMEKATAYTDVTGYNNFYEFGTDKSDPARHAGRLKTRPWSVVVEGEVTVTLKGKVLAIAKEGEIVGEMALISSDLRSATVTAKTDCRLAPIDQASGSPRAMSNTMPTTIRILIHSMLTVLHPSQCSRRRARIWRSAAAAA